MIKAPSEMRSRLTPWAFITISVANTVSSRMAPMRMPERRPMAKTSTPITIRMAWMRLTTKPSTAFTTPTLW